MPKGFVRLYQRNLPLSLPPPEGLSFSLLCVCLETHFWKHEKYLRKPHLGTFYFLLPNPLFRVICSAFFFFLPLLCPLSSLLFTQVVSWSHQNIHKKRKGLYFPHCTVVPPGSIHHTPDTPRAGFFIPDRISSQAPFAPLPLPASIHPLALSLLSWKHGLVKSLPSRTNFTPISP